MRFMAIFRHDLNSPTVSGYQGDQGEHRNQKCRKISVLGFNHRFSLVMGCFGIECDLSTIISIRYSVFSNHFSFP